MQKHWQASLVGLGIMMAQSAMAEPLYNRDLHEQYPSAAQNAAHISANNAMMDWVGENLAFSGSLSLVSDYVYRGISQSKRHPAVQGGWRLDSSNNVYASLWASNVNQWDTKLEVYDIELQWRLGYQFQYQWSGMSQPIDYDLSFVRYHYPGATGINYDEFQLDLGYNCFSGTVAYTGDAFNTTDDRWYFAVGARHEVPGKYLWDIPGVYVGAHVGKTNFSGSTYGTRDYVDYSFFAEKSFGPFDAKISWVNTDDGFKTGPLGEQHFVFGVSIAI